MKVTEITSEEIEYEEESQEEYSDIFMGDKRFYQKSSISHPNSQNVYEAISKLIKPETLSALAKTSKELYDLLESKMKVGLVNTDKTIFSYKEQAKRNLTEKEKIELVKNLYGYTKGTAENIDKFLKESYKPIELKLTEYKQAYKNFYAEYKGIIRSIRSNSEKNSEFYSFAETGLNSNHKNSEEAEQEVESKLQSLKKKLTQELTNIVKEIHQTIEPFVKDAYMGKVPSVQNFIENGLDHSHDRFSRFEPIKLLPPLYKEKYESKLNIETIKVSNIDVPSNNDRYYENQPKYIVMEDKSYSVPLGGIHDQHINIDNFQFGWNF